jgi:hypothetical protein
LTLRVNTRYLGKSMDVHMSVGVSSGQVGTSIASVSGRSEGGEAVTMATVGQVALIVAQAGADPSSVEQQVRVDVPTTVKLHQEPAESLTSLGHRVRARLSQLSSQGYGVHSATFVARRGFGLGDVLATADLLRVLLTSMLAVGGGQVYLQGDAHDARAQVALRALAEAISDQVRGTGIQIVSGVGQIGSPQGFGALA